MSSSTLQPWSIFFWEVHWATRLRTGWLGMASTDRHILTPSAFRP